MAQISVDIGGRPYRMACGEGEEDHLRGLAARLDRKVAEMRDAFGTIGDGRLLVMASLTLVDELVETERRLAEARSEAARLEDRVAAADTERQALVSDLAQRLEGAAARIEEVAECLEPRGRARA